MSFTKAPSGSFRGHGFTVIMLAQFFSALADNALLIAAITALAEFQSPEWHTPILRQVFVFSYIALAPFVGHFADSHSKGQVMFYANSIKFLGCLLMILGFDPLLAYATVGLGAAIYSPAKYGILTDYLPTEKLVWGNAWMEATTVLAIILGVVLGGGLIHPSVMPTVNGLLPVDIFESPSHLACSFIIFLYILAGVFNRYIPKLDINRTPIGMRPWLLLQQFYGNSKKLWQDPLGRMSLAVTTLFWGAGATLQLVVLKFAQDALHLSPSQAPLMMAFFAIGIALGSVIASLKVKLEQVPHIMPIGVAAGFIVMTMLLATDFTTGALLMIPVGAVAGFFIVPMNALLQSRGHVLMGSGNSIAVQNFNENISILLMNGGYAFMLGYNLGIESIVISFGLFLSTAMYVIYRATRA